MHTEMERDLDSVVVPEAFGIHVVGPANSSVPSCLFRKQFRAEWIIVVFIAVAAFDAVSGELLRSNDESLVLVIALFAFIILFVVRDARRFQGNTT